MNEVQLHEIFRRDMTRAYDKFVADAKLAATRKLGIPRDWWGVWRSVYGPNGTRVFFSSGGWTVTHGGVRISRHDSRTFAISKARKLK